MDSEFALTYWSMAAATAIQGCVLLAVRMPAPKEKAQESTEAPPVPCGEVLLNGRGEAAALSTVCYSVMVVVMTPTPLVMQDNGFSYADATTVIQLHLISMFAPSFVTGDIIKRFGARLIAYIGCVVLALAFGVMQLGDSMAHFVSALCLLGFGWNFGFISATNMLAVACPPHEKERFQGLNDMVLFSISSIGTLFSANIIALIGWKAFIWSAMIYVGVVAGVSLTATGGFCRSQDEKLPKPTECSVEDADHEPAEPQSVTVHTGAGDHEVSVSMDAARCAGRGSAGRCC